MPINFTRCGIMRSVLASLFAVLLTCCLPGASAVASQKNRSHNTSGVVLMSVSAHPDDEDGATLAYYTHIKHIKAYSIFYTRGEGGQNVIGPELYKELGEMRTEETLAAAKILGTTVYFLGFPDFGFSKTAKETFRMWGGNDDVLKRIVYLIRALKPDVVITNHDTITTLPYRQHGNHQVVGITIYEAFKAAADPNYHPEQLGGRVTPWQIKKLYFRVLRKSELNQDSLVTIPVNKKSDGKTIQQISWDALRKHRTQGMDKLSFHDLPEVFRQPVYKLILSSKKYSYDPHDLFSGIKLSKRPILKLPEEYAVVLKPFSAYIHPKYSLLGNPADSAGTLRFTMDTFNHTGAAIDLSVIVSHGSQRVLLEHEVLGNNIRDFLNLSVVVPPISSDQDSLEFRAVPHEAANLPGMGAATDVAYLRGTSAKCDTNDDIGLVTTYDNTLQQTFDEFGIKYEKLDSSMLATGNLNQFTTIVLDIRAYLYRHDLVKYNERVLRYVRDGGNVVCFYNRLPEWNGHTFAPYPIYVTNHRVTEETQPVTVLEPEMPLFHYPNEIVPTDWDGWVQERNIYLPSGDTSLTSGKYERLLAMSDEDQHEPSTSLLWARYGNGTYTYTSLALYRQIKILNNGGIKLLFNLISQPRYRRGAKE